MENKNIKNKLNFDTKSIDIKHFDLLVSIHEWAKKQKLSRLDVASLCLYMLQHQYYSPVYENNIFSADLNIIKNNISIHYEKLNGFTEKIDEELLLELYSFRTSSSMDYLTILNLIIYDIQSEKFEKNKQET